MNAYENGVIKYQIDYERYKNGIANEVIRLLDNANIEIAGYIKKTQSVATKARYKQIAKKLNEISKQLKERIEQNIDVDAVIAYELKKENKLFETIKKVLHKGDAGKISFVYPNVEQIKTSALFRPATDGLTYQSYLDGVEAGLFNTWDSAVRTGYLTGIPTKQIVSNVMGGISQIDKLKKAGQIEPLRNAVYGNTRTLLQSFAEEARERVYKDNEQYFGDGEYKYEYLATLDARTCLVCGNYDGKKFKSLEDAPHVPQHRNCRCLIIPYFDIKDDTRASKDGQVSSKTDFATWLEEQDENTQKEVLGATRYKMYKEGVKFEQFVDNGEVLTLPELQESLWTSTTNKGLEKVINAKTTLNYEGVAPVDFGKYDKIPTEEQIIDYVSVKDNNNTSCTSLAFAYGANKSGYNVLDNKGELSDNVFKHYDTLVGISDLKGVKSLLNTSTNQVQSAMGLIQNIRVGKEYILVTGNHTAVIKQLKDKTFRFLELQDKDFSGWKTLNEFALKTRFGCSEDLLKTKIGMPMPSILFDIKSLYKNKDFLDLLRYINTKEI